MAVTSLRDSETLLGIFVSSDNFPTMYGTYGDERLWLMASGTFSSKRGLPAFVGAEGNSPQTVRGSIALGTTPQRIFGHVLSGQANGEGVAFYVDQGTMTVATEGTLGLINRRPRRITLETSEWLLTVEDIHELRGRDVHDKAEKEFLRHLIPAGSIPAGGHPTPAVSMMVAPTASLSPHAEAPTPSAPHSDLLQAPLQMQPESGTFTSAAPVLTPTLSVNSPVSGTAARPALPAAHILALESFDTGEDTLATIAESDVQTWPRVVEHPSCYSDLRLWIEASLEEFSREASFPLSRPERLAELAYEFPQLREDIANNPACYPELRQWITSVNMYSQN
ncbi:hypothetical protein GCM10022198_04020 [Klugiella xanthotipulae]|uniref:Leucine rich repeat variant domain-containing protein n=1 Tax=Klugiella xanthotipulae TaxID=244735 RepID=A0A543HSM7_9MICO|nr:hypothetical protein [Klugiella xanthotipulae]TQM61338.1 hypothetical protein FB466_2289 [Klugiella xanthotipulae]